MTDQTRPTVYTLQELEAIRLIRKAMLEKPEIIREIMKDQGYAQACELLKFARMQLEQLLEVNRAFIAAASELAKKQKEAEANHADN